MTRVRVVEAARRLFVRDGYGSTTIQALAEEAGVAVQTIYASCGSKRGVMKELFDTTVVGDNAQVALIQPPNGEPGKLNQTRAGRSTSSPRRSGW